MEDDIGKRIGVTYEPEGVGSRTETDKHYERISAVLGPAKNVGRPLDVVKIAKVLGALPMNVGEVIAVTDEYFSLQARDMMLNIPLENVVHWRYL